MEFFLSYFILGIFLTSLGTFTQLQRYPSSEVYLGGFLIALVLWPIYITSIFVSIIKDGW